MKTFITSRMKRSLRFLIVLKKSGLKATFTRNKITMLTTEAILKDYHQLKTSRDLDPLLECIGDSRYVLLGEATHGTHEYYTWRTAISKRLIEEKGFSFIAVEGDWPDCYRINRFVKGYTDVGS